MTFSVLTLLGLICLFRLPVDLMPGTDSGVLTIFVGIRGGLPPEDIESLVTKPVEDEMSTLPNLESITSVSRKERAVITLNMKTGTDSAMAALEVEGRLDKIKGKLPREIEEPVISRYDEGQSPVLILALSSKQLTPEEMREVADNQLKPLLKKKDGVANIEIGGGRERKILVEFDKTRLEAYAIPIRQVVSQIGLENLNLQVGKNQRDKQDVGVRMQGAFKNMEEIGRLPISVTKEGSRIFLKDIAEIRDFYLEPESYSRLNREPVVSIYIQKEAQANTVGMAKEVKGAIEEFKKTLDPRITLSIVSDQSIAVEKALKNVRDSLIIGALLAGVVLLAFLKDMLYASFIFVSIPLSLILSLILMSAFNLSLNVMTISGLAIATGMVVDDSIVVLENILHHRSRLLRKMHGFISKSRTAMMIEDESEETLMEKHEIPLLATKEMMLALAASTATRVIVFLPILFLNPQVRALYSGLAITVTASLLFSLLVAVTVIPSLASNVPEAWIKESSFRSKYVWLFVESRFRRIKEILHDFFIKAMEFYAKRLKRKKSSSDDMITTSSLGARRFSIGSRVGSMKSNAAAIFRIFFIVIFSILVFIAVYGTAFKCFQNWSLGLKWLKHFAFIFKGYDVILRLNAWALTLLIALASLAAVSFFRYRQLVAFAMRKRVWVMGILLLVLFDCGVYYRSLDKEFVGSTEENEFIIFVELPSGTKLAVSDKVVSAVEKAVSETQEVQKSVKTSVARVEGWSSKIYVTLVSQAERTKTTQDIIKMLRPVISKIGQEHDAFVYFSEPVSSKEFLIDVFGFDYGKLRDVAVSISQKIEKVQGLADIKLRYKEGRPEVRIEMDREKASLFQFSVQDVAESLHAQIRGLRATYFRTPTAQVETVARLQEQYRKTLEDVELLTLINPKGTIVPIRQFAQFNFGLTPSEIWRKDRERMIQVSANRGDLSLNKVALEVEKSLDGLKIPPGYYYEYGGDFPKMVETEKESRFAFIIMVLLIYVVLASLFESYLQPLVILTAVPLTIIGAIPLLYLTKTPITLGSMIGFIMLGGIAVGNSIILVDVLNHIRKETGILKALLLAGKERTRPILMTSLTAILGLLPLVIEQEGGGSLWAPLAITVIGGLTASTILVLFVLPAFYLLMEDAKAYLRKLVSKRFKPA